MADSAKQDDQASWKPLLFALLFVGVMMISMSSVVLLFFAMLPTLVRYIADRTPQKYATFCVGGMNFCGTFPALLELWTGSNTVSGAFNILTDVFSLAIIYGSAAFGWLVYMAVPPVFGAALTVMAQRRTQHLRAIQERLVEEWGEGLATSAGIDLAARRAEDPAETAESQ